MSDLIKNQECEIDDINEKTIVVKSNKSIAESNIMVLPFVAMNTTKKTIFKRYWNSNGITRGLVVKGSPDLGVPNVKDLDTLLALFRIMLKNSNFQYTYNIDENKVRGLNNEIHFTRRELALEMGYKNYSGGVKNVIDKSLKRLNEATIYSDLSFRNAEKKAYICEFNGEQSFKIIYDLKMYSYKTIKKQGEEIGNYKTVKEQTSLKIHDFFFKNICNNYFKIYDYSQYLKLRLGISKKLFLILNQWSHSSEKYITYKVLYDYLGLEVKERKDVYYYNRQILKSFKELTKVKFIDDFKEIRKKEGINIIFNNNKRNKKRMFDKYNTDAEIVSKLREEGYSYEQIVNYFRLDNIEYVKGLLRLYDYKLEKGEIRDKKKFLQVGLERENYDVEEFIN